MAVGTVVGCRMSRGPWLSLICLLSLILLSACDAPSQSAADTDNSQTPSTSYVTASSLKCRAEAAQSTAAVGLFKKGAAVTTIGAKDGWTHIQQDGKDCWGSSAFLSNAAPVSAASSAHRAVEKHRSMTRASLAEHIPSRVRAIRHHAVRHPALRHPAVRRRSPVYDYSGCPCSGRRICIGPRGGRYCITSGGNKRYGV